MAALHWATRVGYSGVAEGVLDLAVGHEHHHVVGGHGHDEAASQLQGLMGDLDAAVAQAQAGRAPVQPAPAARPDAGRGPGEDGPGVVLVVALP